MEKDMRLRSVAVIPARMASSRFPGKPMQPILGTPMIGHCYHRVRMCPNLDATYVATCDKEIFDYIQGLGGNVVMTSRHHERASDRAAEAMLKIEELSGKPIDLLVMVQGDEPMDTPEMVSGAIRPFNEDASLQVVNLMGNINSVKEFDDPNTVKVVTDQNNNALYFSREPIPSRKKGVDVVPMLKQICVIPFRRDFLLKFNQTPETPLEKIESVDMMRILEMGGTVRMVKTPEESIGVDTPEDLREVEDLMRTDPLLPLYA